MVSMTSCPTDIGQVLDTVLDDGQSLTSSEIGSGLKEALEIGIGNGSDLLSSVDGYYKSGYKILLPAEARKVTSRLQGIPGVFSIGRKYS